MRLITTEGPLPHIETPIPGFLNPQAIPFSDVFYSDTLPQTHLMQELRGPYHNLWDYQLRFRRGYPLSLEVSKPRVLLHYMLSGDGLCLQKTGKEEWIRAGYYYLFCVPKGRHEMSFPSGNYSYAQLELSPGLLANFNFPPDMEKLIKKFYKEPGIVSIPLFKNPIPDTVLETLAEIKTHRCTEKESFDTLFELTSGQLINSFYEDLHASRPIPAKDENELLVKEICIFINGPEPGLRTIPEICKKFFTCATTLRDLFATYLDITVRDYMLNSRMEKAKNFLVTTDYSIQEIAAFLGYEHIQSFCSAFKRQVGVPPLVFRKKFAQP